MLVIIINIVHLIRERERKNGVKEAKTKYERGSEEREKNEK